MCFSRPFDIEFATGSSAGSLRPHSDTVKKIPGLRPGHVTCGYCPCSGEKRFDKLETMIWGVYPFIVISVVLAKFL